MSLRWGIATSGTSKISHDFCVASLLKLSETEHNIIAVASCFKNDAADFARKHNILYAFDSYEELAKNSAVEVVFVAVLNPQRFSVTKLLIEHGKHVVCAPPLAMNSKEGKELFQIAENHRVFFMEGHWSRFCPVYRHLFHLIEEKYLDTAKEIYVKHGLNSYLQECMDHGVVLNIGSYAIQFVLFIFREAPKSIKAQGKINRDGIDLHFEAELLFSKGRKAMITCSALSKLGNQATIISTKGVVCIPEYWCPTKYFAFNRIYQWDLNVPIDTAVICANSIGLKYQADAVALCLRAGKKYCRIMPSVETILIAKIQDEIRKQIGVHFECDKE